MILAKAELGHPKNQATIVLFILQKLYSWRACSHKRNAFYKKKATEPGVWRRRSQKPKMNRVSIFFLNYLDTIFHCPVYCLFYTGFSSQSYFCFSLSLLLFYLSLSFWALIFSTPAVCAFCLSFPVSLTACSPPGISLLLSLCFLSCLFGHGPISPIGLVAV